MLHWRRGKNSEALFLAEIKSKTSLDIKPHFSISGSSLSHDFHHPLLSKSPAPSLCFSCDSVCILIHYNYLFS